MKFLLILLPLLFLFNTCRGDIAEDLKHLLDNYQWKTNDSSCIFNHTIINSKTIKSFPKCTRVVGILVINEKTDLSVPQLTEVFKNMTSLVGGMRIENTNLTTLSFLPIKDASSKLYIYCRGPNLYDGVYIRNNTQMNDSSLMHRMYLYSNSEGNECHYRIENNPQLSFGCYDGYLRYYVDIYIFGNKVNCGCRFDEKTTSFLDHYPNCGTLLGGLKLSNITHTTSLTALSNITYIRGSVVIHDTNLQNVSFLENLDFIRFRNYENMTKLTINIYDNANMIRLAWHRLEDIRSSFDYDRYANLENLHPDFCLTIEEMMLFLMLNVSFLNIEAKYCEENPGMMINGSKLCRFKSFSKLENDCQMIWGNLIIDSGDDEEFSKLEEVKYLFGTLTIRNTKLEDLKSLKNLQYIASLSDSRPIIQIYSNKNLVNAELSRVSNIIVNGNRTIIIQDNHSTLFGIASCDLFAQKPLNMYDEPIDLKKYGTNFAYYGDNCGMRVDIPSSNSMGFKFLPALLLLIFSTMQ